MKTKASNACTSILDKRSRGSVIIMVMSELRQMLKKKIFILILVEEWLRQTLFRTTAIDVETSTVEFCSGREGLHIESGQVGIYS